MRNHRTAASLAGVLAATLAGCGTAASVTVNEGASTKAPKALTIYTDLAVKGPPGAEEPLIEQSIENGARLALESVAHRVSYGPRGHPQSFHVYLTPLNDADSATGVWSRDLTGTNAQAAAADRTTVAYIGNFDSAATALSLQALSPSEIVQISPWSPYIGFTDANQANGKGDPARYYLNPTGQHTFARLVPSDLAEAKAIVSYMRWLGVRRLYVLGDVSVFNAAIAQLVANAAQPAGITVVGQQPGIDTQTNAQPLGYASIASGVAAQRPDAVLLGGTPGPGAIALWNELHAMLPQAKLFAPSTLATPTFLHGIAATTGATSATGSTSATGPTSASGATAATGPSSATDTNSATGTKSATGTRSATGSTSANAATSLTGTTSVSAGASSAASATYVTSPILEPGQYPAAAQKVFVAYRRRFKTAPTPYALYGYEAVRDVLAAIAKAGRQSTNRPALLKIFFHGLGVIHGAIGTYTINGNGDTSLTSFDGYRVSPAGRLVLAHRIS